ncbi:MAG: 50S ribosomal protein L11 methyltransferase, partial [Pseudomonadota bacterium]|nr:50S ribosomal protein L11 methyltransferase [Pseudomonadota bacterium]
AVPLIAMASVMTAHLAPTGQLIVSGLLNTQRQRVVARYRHAGLTVQKDIRIGPWTSLMFRR